METAGLFIVVLPLKPVSFLFKKSGDFQALSRASPLHRGCCRKNSDDTGITVERACPRRGPNIHRKFPRVDPLTINRAEKSSVRTAPSSPRSRLSKHSNALAPISVVGWARRGNPATHQRIPIQVIQSNQADILEQIALEFTQRMGAGQRRNPVGAKQRFRAGARCVEEGFQIARSARCRFR